MQIYFDGNFIVEAKDRIFILTEVRLDELSESLLQRKMNINTKILYFMGKWIQRTKEIMNEE